MVIWGQKNVSTIVLKTYTITTAYDSCIWPSESLGKLGTEILQNLNSAQSMLKNASFRISYQWKLENY
jgi:hypothetical protein